MHSRAAREKKNHRRYHEGTKFAQENALLSCPSGNQARTRKEKREPTERKREQGKGNQSQKWGKSKFLILYL